MINSAFTEGVLTLFLEGRIDTANATVVDTEIAEAISSQASKPTALVFDCTKLQYISSTGLRVVLKYKKLFADLKVLNVNNDVYSVFEMTGFARIMTVQKALRKVDLTQCKLLAQGGNGAVYRINEEEIIKVQHLADTEQMMRDEIRRAKSAFIFGVPTAISFDIVDCGDGRHGAVYEALNSDTLGRYVHAHPEKLQECAIKYAELLKTLHTTDATDSEFVSIKQSYRAYYQEAAKYYTAEELTILDEILDMIPDRNTLVHADAHTNNILLGANGELMFIDMADTDLGHPIFDYSGIALAMIVPLGGNRDTVAICGMEKDEIIQFITIAFAHLFGLTDPEDIKQIIPRLFSLSFIKHTMIIAHNNKSVNEIRPILMNLIRERFFGNLEQIKKDIQWFIDRV